MSLIQQVASIVREKKRASIDDIHIEGKTRQQVQKAMQNAVQRGLIKAAAHRQRGLHQGRRGSIYEPAPPKAPKPIVSTAPASVWEFASLIASNDTSRRAA